MGTPRLPLAVAAMLALLAALPASAAGQPEQQAASGPDHAWVTLVSEDCDGDMSQTSEGRGDGYSWWRGYTYDCDLEFSDPRVSGRLTGVFGDDCFGPTDTPCVFWNSERIDGPDGYWSGYVWGTHRAESPQAAPLATSLKVFTGHGAYDGLTFLVHGLGDLGEQDFYGLIYQGAPPPMPPPMPPPPEPAATEAEPAGEPAATADDEATATDERPVAVEDEAEVTSDDAESELSGTAVYIDGLRTWQYWEGEDTIYELKMSDPRANGIYTERGATVVGDEYDGDSMRPSLVVLLEVTLVNDEGAWSGLESAVWDDEMGWRLDAWLAGEDAYDGLTLYLQGERFPVYSTPNMDFDGIIFEGDPPVMLKAVEVPPDAVPLPPE